MWSHTAVCTLITPTAINLCRCVWLRYFTPKLMEKIYFKLLITLNMFFGCHKPVLGKFLFKDIWTRGSASNIQLILAWGIHQGFTECTALLSTLLQVGRNNSDKICPPVVGTDTFISVIEQTSPLKIFQLIPCKHPFSKLSITHDQLDAERT